MTHSHYLAMISKKGLDLTYDTEKMLLGKDHKTENLMQITLICKRNMK